MRSQQRGISIKYITAATQRPENKADASGENEAQVVRRNGEHSGEE